MIAENWQSEIKTSLCSAYGARFEGAVLYGSEARNDASEDSDIDVLVLLRGPIRVLRDIQTAVKAVYQLSLRYGRPISAKPVDAAEYEAANFPLYANAKREGIVL